MEVEKQKNMRQNLISGLLYILIICLQLILKDVNVYYFITGAWLVGYYKNLF